MKCEKNPYTGAETWSYEPEEQAEANRHIMEKERQKQDYHLAIVARFLVAFVLCFSLGMGNVALNLILSFMKR